MRVAAYIQPLGLRNPTGVTKHEIQMVAALARTPGVEVTLLVAKENRPLPPLPAPLAGLPLIRLPWARKPLELWWSLADWPVVDRWLPPGIDWIYCPMEAFIPTRRARLAVTIHQARWFDKDSPWYSQTRRVRWRQYPLFRRILARGDLVLTVSEFLKEQLCRFFHAEPNRMVVVGNGVEEEYFRTDLPPPDPAVFRRPYWLSVNALVPCKGAAALLNVARCLRLRRPELNLVIAGGAWGEPDLVRAAAECPNLILTGYLGLDQLPALMKHACGLLNLSRIETFGIPVIEAMAAGTPVIAARMAGLPEVVGTAGSLVDPDRPEEVVEQILALQDNAALRDRLTAQGSVRVREFTWPACAARLIQALQRKGQA